MALEDAIKDLNDSVKALTAQLKGGAAAGATAGGKAPATAGRPPAKTGPKNTMDTVAAAAAKVKGELSKEAAVWLIANVGKAEKMAAIKPENFDAFVAACEKAIEAGEVEGMAAAEDDDM